MPSLSHNTEFLMRHARTLGTIRTYVPGGVAIAPDAVILHDTASLDIAIGGVYDTARLDPANRAAWEAQLAAYVPPATAHIISFLGGVMEFGAREYTLDSGPMINAGDTFHSQAIDLEEIWDLLSTGSYVLAAVPDYGEPKLPAEATALGLDYYITRDGNGEFTLQYAEDPFVANEVAKAGGYSRLQSLMLNGTATPIQRQALYRIANSRVMMDICIKGVRYILQKVADAPLCCNGGVNYSLDTIRFMSNTSMEVPGAPFTTTLQDGTNAFGLTADFGGLIDGVYPIATFFAGAPVSPNVTLIPGEPVATVANANISYIRGVGPDFGPPDVAEGDPSNGPGSELGYLKGITFYETQRDAELRINGRTLVEPQSYEEIEAFMAYLMQSPGDDPCNVCMGLGWETVAFATASFFDLSNACSAPQSAQGIHPLDLGFFTANNVTSFGPDIEWLGRVNPIYSQGSNIPIYAPSVGGSALHMHANPVPLIRFDILVDPAAVAPVPHVTILPESVTRSYRVLP